jgi:hypothetical protein
MTNPSGARGVDFAFVRDCALALPGVEEGPSYGTPAFRVARKVFLRLREDGDSLVLKTDFFERDFLLGSDPTAFFTEAHYDGYPAVLVRLSTVPREQMRGLIVDAWRRLASRKLLAAYDARPG